MAVCIREFSGRNLKRSQGVKQFKSLHFTFSLSSYFYTFLASGFLDEYASLSAMKNEPFPLLIDAVFIKVTVSSLKNGI